MSEKFDRRPQNYSEYDAMSTEQLQEILRLDAHCTDGIGMDTDELFYIMEVLSAREENSGTNSGKTVQEAYDSFRKHYLPQEDPAPVSRKSNVMPAWLRRAVAAVAVMAIFITATVTVNAFGFDLWGKVAQWSEDFFRFEDETQATMPSDPDKSNTLGFATLQEALAANKISQRLAPTWIPGGYYLDEVECFESPREMSIYANYKKGEDKIKISIRKLVGTNPEDVEISENLIEAYEANGVTYYIFSNNTNLQAAWVLEEYECLIIGRLTIDEMKAILNSI